jgi:hypothetical protein
MTSHKGKAKRIFNNATMKRPSSKNAKRKKAIKLYETRQQSNFKSYKVARQRDKEY